MSIHKSFPNKYIAPVTVALLMACISSWYLFKGSALSLVPWGLLALVWGVAAKDSREARKRGAVYGFSLGFSFLWVDKAGHTSVAQSLVLMVIISGLGLLAGGCAAVASMGMYYLTQVKASKSIFLLGAINMATLVLFITLTKHIASPWANDPYDGVISYALIIVALLVAFAVLRLVIERKQGGTVVRSFIFIEAISLAVVVAAASGWVVNGGATSRPIALFLVLLVSTVVFGLLLIARRANALAMFRTAKGLNNAPFIALRKPGAMVGFSVVAGIGFSLWHSVAEGSWANLFAATIFAGLAAGAVFVGLFFATRVLKII
ncbi:MAG TPA: hypothetical protein VLE99_04915 [Candidatus Saccharimonadales bacterium]|nr:hypothetical protein [Candidatus Saccharimonadales bacterium]